MNELSVKSQNTDLIESSWNALSTETQKAYQSDLSQFLNFVRKEIEEIAPGDVKNYIDFLRSKELKNSTINRKIASISKMFTVYLQAGRIQNNPVALVRTLTKTNYKTQRNVKSPIKFEQIKSALSLKSKTESDRRLIVLIKFLATTGCRISEAITAKKIDIQHHSEGTKKLRVFGKGQKERFLYVSDKLLKEISIYHNCDKFLFCSTTGKRLNRTYMWFLITRYFKNTIGSHVHPHMLRHFFATHKISVEGRDIKSVSKYLGHSDVSTTLNMYVDTVMTDEEASIDL